MIYSAMMVTFDCNSPTQKPSDACVVRKKSRDRSIASVTRPIQSLETAACATMAESGCVAMGDLLRVIGPGTSTCFCNLRPLLTHPCVDLLRPVRNLFYPPRLAVHLACGCSIIYPVKGPPVKGILAYAGYQTLPLTHLQEPLARASMPHREGVATAYESC
jgi:hypothetical protein